MNRISLSRAQTYVNRQTSVALHRQHFRGEPGKEKNAELSAEQNQLFKNALDPIILSSNFPVD